mmetsp:Transcript_4317/g.10419  ORF Transcript_4317/g.10419 Transcript_4317/m.10419 type:complete len:234 (+) Transcript_4317:259-960(+)
MHGMCDGLSSLDSHRLNSVGCRGLRIRDSHVPRGPAIAVTAGGSDRRRRPPGKSRLQDVQHERQDDQFRKELDSNKFVPKWMRKGSGYRVFLLPVHIQVEAKDALQEGTGKEEKVARHCDPYDSRHLTFCRYLIDGTECFQNRFEAMRKHRDLVNAYKRDNGKQKRIEQYHSLGRVELEKESRDVSNLEHNQEGDPCQKDNHGYRTTRGRMEVLFENVGPVDQDEDEDAKQRE